MKIFGGIFMALGLLVWVGGMTMITTTETALLDKINNIGLMQGQMIATNGGAILFLSGVILVGLGIIHESMLKKLTSIEKKLQKEEAK